MGSMAIEIPYTLGIDSPGLHGMNPPWQRYWEAILAKRSGREERVTVGSGGR